MIPFRRSILLCYSALAILCFAFGCKVPTTTSVTPFENQGRQLSFLDIRPSKENPSGLAVLLPDQPDTLNLEKSLLVSSLVGEGFRVIIPRKAGKNINEKIELDSKPNRVSDINSILRSLDTTGLKEFIVIGIGEGAYIVPDLRYRIAPSLLLVVNAGPYSLLTEYENLLKSRYPDQGFLNTLMEQNLFLTKGEFVEHVQNVRSNPFGPAQLNGGTNHYWLSYDEDPLRNRIIRPSEAVVWVISEEYALVSEENQKLARDISESLGYIDFLQIEGKGDFNQEKEMKALTELVLKAINN